MMITKCVAHLLFGILILGGAKSEAAPVAVRDPQAVIPTYQPPWTPKEGQLRGETVVINPVYTGGAGDRVALVTADHLFHLVRQARGIPALTRVDERPLPAGSDPIRFVADFCAARRADMLINISCTRQSRKGVIFAEESPASAKLAQALAVELQWLVPFSETAEPGCPTVTLDLPSSPPPEPGVLPHRRMAEAIFRGLAAFAAKGTPASQPSVEGGAPVPYYPLMRENAAIRRLVTAVCPERDLKPARAAWFCDLLTRMGFSDRTNVYFDYNVTVEGDAVTITGATAVPHLRGFLEDGLHRAGVENVTTRMRLLPEESDLGEQLFGICSAEAAMTFAKPAESAPPQSQLLERERVFLIDRREGYFLTLAQDGYWGWVRGDSIRVVDQAEFAASLGKRTPAQEELIEEQVTGALMMLDMPYVFGGRAQCGLDCSGFVGGLEAVGGEYLARDAAQQYVSGRLVATRWYRDELSPGDRIYFINDVGKIFHAGLMLDGSHFVHCSPPCVQISSLRPGDRLYGEHWDRDFLGARR